MKHAFLWTAACLALAFGFAQVSLAGPTRIYHAHGVLFRYPAVMTVETQMNADVATIILQDTKYATTATVQVCPPVLTPAQIGAVFMQSIQSRVGPGSHMTGPDSVRMQVAGAGRSGREYRLTLGGAPGLVRLFSFRQGGKVLNVAEFRPDAPPIRIAGEADFMAVAGSLRVQP